MRNSCPSWSPGPGTRRTCSRPSSWRLSSWSRLASAYSSRRAFPRARPRPCQIVVVEKLVAAPHQQRRSRIPHAAADHTLVILLQLRSEGGEVTVAGQERENLDVILRITEIERVDDHPDVCTVLATHLRARNIHEFDPTSMKVPHVVRTGSNRNRRVYRRSAPFRARRFRIRSIFSCRHFESRAPRARFS